MAAAYEQWECHICHGGPYMQTNTTRCLHDNGDGTVCNHDVCDSCPKDNDIKPPLVSSRAPMISDRLRPAAAMGWSESSPYYASPRSNASHVQAVCSPGYYSTSSRPPLAGSAPRYMPLDQSRSTQKRPHQHYLGSAPPSSLSHGFNGYSASNGYSLASARSVATYSQPHARMPPVSSAPITTRPGMWYCCICGNPNTLALTGGRCSFCPHSGPCHVCRRA